MELGRILTECGIVIMQIRGTIKMPKLTAIGLSVIVILFGISLTLNIPQDKQPIFGGIMIAVGLINGVLAVLNKHAKWIK